MAFDYVSCLMTVSIAAVAVAWQSQGFNTPYPSTPLNWKCSLEMRAQKTDLPKTMETGELTIFEAVWGEMHIEYDVFKKRFDVTPYLQGRPTTEIHAHIGAS
jgi:hypothetical protein